MKKVHWTLTGLSLTIVLLSLNRLTSFTAGYLQPYEFLRWVDFNAMLPIPLFSVVLYYLLKRQITYDSPFRNTSRYVLLIDRKSTRLNSSHANISYAVFCLKKKKHQTRH